VYGGGGLWGCLQGLSADCFKKLPGIAGRCVNIHKYVCLYMYRYIYVDTYIYTYRYIYIDICMGVRVRGRGGVLQKIVRDLQQGRVHIAGLYVYIHLYIYRVYTCVHMYI